MIGNLQARLADIHDYKLPTYVSSGNHINDGMEKIGQLETKVNGHSTLTPEVIVPMMWRQPYPVEDVIKNPNNPIARSFGFTEKRVREGVPNQLYTILDLATMDNLSRASGGSLKPEDMTSNDEGDGIEVDFDVHVETHALYDPTTDITYFFLMPARPNKK